MATVKTIKTENLVELLDSGSFKKLRRILNQMHPADLMDFLETLEVSQALLVFRMLSKDNALHTFAMLNSSMQQDIINSITDAEVQAIIDNLWVDDTVDMLEEMPANLVKKVLSNSAPETRALINQYLAYPENSVGSIMTAEFIEFRADQTVRQALEILRKTSSYVETIYTCFITDNTRVLEGYLELDTLLLADDDSILSELITGEIIKAHTTLDKEEAARLLMKYDLISLPVVDKENRLVGIVTIDDAIDVIIDEDTKDIEKMAAIIPSEIPYIETEPFRLALNRLPWLAVSLLTNVVVSKVFDLYTPVYAAFPILVSFIPMLMGTGGNAGSQTSTIIIRGLAIGELSFKDFWKIFFKELGVSVMIGGILGVFSFLRILLIGSNNMAVAFMVAVSIFASITIGKIVGAIFPLVAQKLRFDPALMAAPLVTTVVDVLIIILFFSIAQFFIAAQLLNGGL